MDVTVIQSIELPVHLVHVVSQNDIALFTEREVTYTAKVFLNVTP